MVGVDRGDELSGFGQDSDAMVRAICDAAVEGILIIEEDGTIVSCNAAGEAMFGYAHGELLGRHVLDLATPEWRDLVRDSYQGRKEHTYEAVGVRKDGSTFRAEVRTRNVRVGDRLMRAGAIRDFSAQDELERQRAASISLLRATLDSTADGILVVDRNGRIVLYNDRFISLWALPAAVLEQQLDTAAVAFVEGQLLDPRSFRERIAALYDAPEDESTDLLELRDGRSIERYTRPQRIGHHIIGRIWSFRDVTSQRRAERALELAVQMRDEFLAIASHELFTPITSLGVAMRGLRVLGAGATDGPGGRLLATAERQVSRLTRLVQELLDVARIDGGRLGLTLDDVDLSSLVRDVIDRFAPELERDRVEVTLQAEAPVRGHWDRSRLEQVVTNLLANAIKFGLGRPIELRVRAADMGAELSVRDHGIGVAAEQKAQIFERFQRAVSSRHFAGLGLGLYITRQIVEAHGGRLHVDSAPGEGATFTVVLPPTAMGRAP